MKIYRQFGSMIVLGTMAVIALHSSADTKSDSTNGLIETQANLKKILATQAKRPEPELVIESDGGTTNDAELFESRQYKKLEDLSGYRKHLTDNCKADELQFLEMQDALLYPWKKAWMNSDTKTFLSLLEKNATIPEMSEAKLKSFRKIGEITESNWPKVIGSAVGSRRSSSIEKYLQQFDHFEDIEFAVMQIKSDRKDRNTDMSIRRAKLQMRCDIRGFDKFHARREDRGNMEVTVEKNSQGEWKIAGIRALGFQTLRSDKPSFVDVTQNALGDQIPTYLRTEAIRRGGYALAVGDYDGDGNPDMYVGAFGPGVLLKGDGKGGFKEVKDSGLEGETLVKSAIFADFSNSGRQDLLLIRFTPTKEGEKLQEVRNDVVLYRNMGNGKFRRDETKINRVPSDYAMPAAVADFNHDGFLDFYVGFPGAKDFTSLTDPDAAESNVQVQGLFMNREGKSFERVSEAAAFNDNHSFKQKI
jgi:hypothetical protein